MLVVLMILMLQTAGVSVAQGIALTIAGGVAPFVAQVLKKWSRLNGPYAMLLAAAVSAAIALVASFIAGDWHTIGDLVKNAAAVFGLATVVYHLIPQSS